MGTYGKTVSRQNDGMVGHVLFLLLLVGLMGLAVWGSRGYLIHDETVQTSVMAQERKISVGEISFLDSFQIVVTDETSGREFTAPRKTKQFFESQKGKEVEVLLDSLDNITKIISEETTSF